MVPFLKRIFFPKTRRYLCYSHYLPYMIAKPPIKVKLGNFTPEVDSISFLLSYIGKPASFSYLIVEGAIGGQPSFGINPRFDVLPTRLPKGLDFRTPLFQVANSGYFTPVHYLVEGKLRGARLEALVAE